MSSELHEIDDSGVRAAFDGYRANPGGDIRLDTAAVTALGQRRVRRQRIAYSAAGVTAIAVLVSSAVAAGGQVPTGELAEGAVKHTPPTGRDVAKLFNGAPGWHEKAPVKAGGPATKVGMNAVAAIDETPDNLDAAWQAGVDGPDAATRWALFTWIEDERAAEALLTVQDDPIYIAIYPPPYQVCDAHDTQDGRTCSVREVKGEGWLKVIRGGNPKQSDLTVRLQRDGGELLTLHVVGGAATKNSLVGGRRPLGALPISEDDATKAVLEAL